MTTDTPSASPVRASGNNVDAPTSVAAPREHFASRLGFILISAGCAIGLGNGGFFACYSYVNPIMETVASVPTSLMSAVIALAGFGGLVISGKPPGVPAPEYEEQGDGHCQAARSGQYEKGGRSHRVFLCLFPCKNSNLFPENTPYRGMCVNLAPQRNF